MGLNIKNERVHELARRAAEVTGKSQTGAIEEALMRLLEAHDVDPTRAAMSAKIDLVHDIADAFVAESARHRPARDADAIRAVDDLYDAATGLPR